MFYPKYWKIEVVTALFRIDWVDPGAGKDKTEQKQ